MAYQTFKLPCDATAAACELVNAFLRSHAVLGVQKEWVSAGDASFWSFCVQYHEGGTATSISGPSRAGMASKVDYREVLSAEQFHLYARLRDVRKGLAEKAGLPVFAVFTNEQLAEMVKTSAHTLTDIKAIAGVGDAKLEKYGEAMVVALATVLPSTAVNA